MDRKRIDKTKTALIVAVGIVVLEVIVGVGIGSFLFGP
jgi:hypothetical protein